MNKKSFRIAFILMISLFIAFFFLFFNLYILAIITVFIGIIFLFFFIEFKFYDFALILTPFMFYMNIGGTINVSLADFVILVWVLCSIKNGKSYILCLNNAICKKTQKYLRSYAAFFIFVMFISLINIIRWENPMIVQGIISVFKIFICFLYSLFILFYIDKFGRNRFLAIMAYCTIIFDLLMIIGVVAYNLGLDLGLTFAGTFRATGTFEDPNLAATYLFLMFSFTGVYFSEKKKYFTLSLSMVLTFIGVFLTSSKGALVALSFGLVGLIIFSILRGNIGNVLKLIMVYVIIFLVLIYLYEKYEFIRLLCEPIFNRLQEFTSNIQGDHSLAHREFLWKTAFDLGMQEPILGIGVEQFRTAATQFIGINVWNIVHNTYLTFFCEMGLLGIVAFYRLWVKDFIIHFSIMKQNNCSLYYLFSLICVSVSMWSISLGNFRTLWIFMTFVLFEYNRIIFQTIELENL